MCDLFLCFVCFVCALCVSVFVCGWVKSRFKVRALPSLGERQVVNTQECFAVYLIGTFEGLSLAREEIAVAIQVWVSVVIRRFGCNDAMRAPLVSHFITMWLFQRWVGTALILYFRKVDSADVLYLHLLAIHVIQSCRVLMLALSLNVCRRKGALPRAPVGSSSSPVQMKVSLCPHLHPAIGHNQALRPLSLLWLGGSVQHVRDV